MDDQPKIGKKILCIEDEVFISELYQRSLNKAGHNTQIILNGEEGLALAQTNQFDLILLDLMLPMMTGMEVLRRLRDPKVPQIKAKIIITTNFDVDEQQKEELMNLADGYLVKAEITPNQLADFVGTISW